MPDTGILPAQLASPPPAAARPASARRVSPLLRRILLVNLVPLALLLAALLYLDQYQNGLLQAEVSTLREQARIYAERARRRPRCATTTPASRGWRPTSPARCCAA